MAASAAHLWKLPNKEIVEFGGESHLALEIEAQSEGSKSSASGSTPCVHSDDLVWVLQL